MWTKQSDAQFGCKHDCSLDLVPLLGKLAVGAMMIAAGSGMPLSCWTILIVGLGKA